MTLDAQQTLALAKAVCEANGFAVIESGKWVKPGTLATSLGIPTSSLSSLLHDPACPAFEARRGPSGRINYLRETLALRRWLKRAWIPKGALA